MSTVTVARPGADEHSPYYGKYIERVPDGDLVALLREQILETAALLRRSSGRADFAYGPGKWTVKEVVGHLADRRRGFYVERPDAVREPVRIDVFSSQFREA